AISDRGLVHLKPPVRLKKLLLTDTQIADTAVTPLAGPESLEDLCIFRTDMTFAGVRELKRLKAIVAENAVRPIEPGWLAGTRGPRRVLSRRERTARPASPGPSARAGSRAARGAARDRDPFEVYQLCRTRRRWPGGGRPSPGQPRRLRWPGK